MKKFVSSFKIWFSNFFFFFFFGGGGYCINKFYLLIYSRKFGLQKDGALDNMTVAFSSRVLMANDIGHIC